MRKLILLAMVAAAGVIAGARVDAQQEPQGQGRPASELQKPRRIEYGKRDHIRRAASVARCAEWFECGSRIEHAHQSLVD